MPLPKSLKGGAAKKVIDSLLAKGLVAEAEANVLQSDTIWRKTDDGKAVTLVATETACEALNIGEFDAGPGAAAPSAVDVDTNAAETGATASDAGAQVALGAKDAPPAAMDATTAESAPVVPASPRPRKTRENSKQAQLIAMLQRPGGATIEEIVAAFGWQAHTVRGALAGALKKKLGLNVVSDKVDGRGRTYKIAE